MSEKTRPGVAVVGAALFLLGLAMTIVVVIGLVRGGNRPMLLALWPIVGALPLWGGIRNMRRGLGRDDGR